MNLNIFILLIYCIILCIYFLSNLNNRHILYIVFIPFMSSIKNQSEDEIVMILNELSRNRTIKCNKFGTMQKI